MTYYKNLFYVILLVILFFSCKTSSAMETLDANDTRLIFGSSTDSTPYARTWDNSALSWGSVTSTLTASATIKWTVHKIGLSNAEELVGVLADVGATDKLVMLRYADPSWSADWVADSVPDAGKREFDIEYEAASGDALVVYSNNTTNPEYRTRSGGSWSATSSVFSTPPGSGSVQWIKLAQRPSSNEIALVYSDANSDLFTVIWDGSSWTESTTETTLETNLAQITTDVFDVEYEQTSGDLMVVWAPTANIYYGLKLVSSNTFTTGTVLTATTPTFVDLAAQPDGRRMAVGYLSNSDDMRTSLWDGDAWVNGLTVDSTAGSPGAGDAMAQVGWVGDTDTVVIIYYDTSDGAGSRLHWLKATSTGTFVQQTDVTGITGCANATQQSYVVESFTTLDKLMVIMSDGSNDICALTYNGSSWTVTNSGTALGTELSSSSSVPFSLGMSQTLPSLNFSSATSTNSEASTTVTFSIDISTTTERVTTFYYSIAASSTATGSGTDYTLANGTTSIISGSSTTSISVTITDDSLDENDETIVIQLSSSTNATLGTTTQHVYTITDNDSAPTIQFSLATSTGSESTATGTLEIALSASSSFTITVQYTVQSSSTATGSGTDYTLANGTSTISAGNTTTSISITIVNDAVDEVDETIVLQLSTSTNATLGTTTQHIYTTTDDDDAPTLSFISSTSSYSEGSATATLILQLSATSSQSITIQYRALSTSTATGSGSDFTLANGTSTISAGNSTTSIQVTLIDDSLDEDSELIYVNIHTPTNATVGSTSTHTLTLTDNRLAPI